MIVEFIGITGSGKSIIVEEVISGLKGLGVNVSSSYAYFLSSHKLGWIKNAKLSSIATDLLSLPYVFLSLKKYHRLISFAAKIVYRDADSFIYATNVMRNVLKRIGVYEFLARRNNPDKLFITDEGIVQQVHGLFVHLRSHPRDKEIACFSDLVPQPDMVIYMFSPKKRLTERTHYRGHQRIRELTEETIDRFIENALYAFSALVSKPGLTGRVFPFENSGLGPQGISATSNAVINHILGAYRA
jgi:hypothetical protein